MKYMLITVCEREIMTEIFDSLEPALETRKEEMLNAWYGEDDEIREALENNDEYDGGGDFAFDEWRAFVNGRDNWDWAIVELPENDEKEDMRIKLSEEEFEKQKEEWNKLMDKVLE